jgi:signal recognition particle subunit SEC65
MRDAFEESLELDREKRRKAKEISRRRGREKAQLRKEMAVERAWERKKTREEARQAKFEAKQQKWGYRAQQWGSAKKAITTAGKAIATPVVNIYNAIKERRERQPPPTTILKEKKSSALRVLIALIVIFFVVYVFTPLCDAESCKAVQYRAREYLGTIEEKTHIAASASGIWSKVTEKYIVAGIEATSPWKNPDVKLKEATKKRIVLENLEGEFVYMENKPIKVSFSVEIDNLKKDADLTFSCDLKGYEGKTKVRLGYYNIEQEGSITKEFLAETNPSFPVECIFEQGISLEGTDVEYKDAKLFVVYDGVTQSKIRVHTLAGDADDKIKKEIWETIEGKIASDALNKEGLWQDRYIRSEAVVEGPIILSLGLPRQPFGKGDSVGLYLNVKNNPNWGGELVELKRLSIRNPKVMSFNKEYCECFVSNHLDTKVIEKLDEYLKGEKDFESSFCVSGKDKNDLTFQCEFLIDNPTAGLVPADELSATVEYAYRLEKVSRIKVERSLLGEEYIRP